MVAPAVPAAFDHVVYAAPNLDEAVADLAARLGVRAAPGGCTLVGFHAEHPDPGLVRGALSALGVEVRVEEGPTPALVTDIDSPNGRVELR